MHHLNKEPSGRRVLVSGSIPTRFMPEKSIQTPRPTPRKPPVRPKNYCLYVNDALFIASFSSIALVHCLTFSC